MTETSSWPHPELSRVLRHAQQGASHTDNVGVSFFHQGNRNEQIGGRPARQPPMALAEAEPTKLWVSLQKSLCRRGWWSGSAPGPAAKLGTRRRGLATVSRVWLVCMLCRRRRGQPHAEVQPERKE